MIKLSPLQQQIVDKMKLGKPLVLKYLMSDERPMIDDKTIARPTFNSLLHHNVIAKETVFLDNVHYKLTEEYR